MIRPRIVEAGLAAALLAFAAARLAAMPTEKAMQAYMEKLAAEARQEEKRRLDELKKTSPEAYAQQMESLKRQKEIDKIVRQFHDGTLTEAEAEKRLTPLLRAELQPERESAPARIQQLEKELAQLRAAQKDPDSLVKRRVAEALGKAVPEGGLPSGPARVGGTP